jgi:hypothetical protein
VIKLTFEPVPVTRQRDIKICRQSGEVLDCAIILLYLLPGVCLVRHGREGIHPIPLEASSRIPGIQGPTFSSTLIFYPIGKIRIRDPNP